MFHEKVKFDGILFLWTTDNSFSEMGKYGGRLCLRGKNVIFESKESFV